MLTLSNGHVGTARPTPWYQGGSSGPGPTGVGGLTAIGPSDPRGLGPIEVIELTTISPSSPRGPRTSFIYIKSANFLVDRNFIFNLIFRVI